MAKSKQQKQLERRKKYERERNLRHHQPKPKYVLHVKDGGGWKPAMRFYSWEEVEKHEENMEDLRRRNAADIVEAVVVEVKTGKHVKQIKPHTMKDPAFIGVQAPEGVQAPPEEKPTETAAK